MGCRGKMSKITLLKPFDDAEALAKGIQCVLDDKVKAEKLSASGMLKAKKMSYTHRAQLILQACGLPGASI